MKSARNRIVQQLNLGSESLLYYLLLLLVEYLNVLNICFFYLNMNVISYEKN